ncbi:MAG: MBOAT family protein [Spirochaetes bacterium]|nr:MBOAT family protein [Spirochaetota bacterium]
MAFNSVDFLFIFLPIVLALNTVIKKEWRNPLLLAASLVFYALGEKYYVILLVASALMNYGFARMIGRNGGKPRLARRIITVAIIVNVGMLAFFKYTAFIVANLNAVLPLIEVSPILIKPLHIPIGISFFTFQTLSYLVDVYRRDSRANDNPLETSLYITMFPQIVSGPIMRYDVIAGQLARRQITLDGFTQGIRRFIIGLGKKMIIATALGNVANQVFAIAPDLLSCEVAWLGVICYTFQLFFDFSGYTDMAIGVAGMLGFTLTENFNYPYISQSMREFWRRWHITLSAWFRDYVYIPLGGNRQSKANTFMNIMIVFILTGLWHGANWTFIVWGLWHGLFQLVERTRLGDIINRSARPLRHGYALLVVMIGWVFFRSADIGGAFTYLKSMAGFNGLHNGSYFPAMYLTGEVIFALAAALLFSTPIAPWLENRIREGISRIGNSALGAVAKHGFAIGGLALLLSIFLYSVMAMAGGTYSPFIYSRF